MKPITGKKDSLDDIREWYSEETNRKVEEFDDYDLHVCRVVFGYVNKK